MKSVPRISDAEWEIMKVLWRISPCNAQEVIDSLRDQRNWRPGTIRTLLNRLVQKEAVSFKKKGRAYIYSPSVSERESLNVAATSFLDRVFDGALTPFIAHFSGSGRKLSSEEISELQKLLDISLDSHD